MKTKKGFFSLLSDIYILPIHSFRTLHIRYHTFWYSYMYHHSSTISPSTSGVTSSSIQLKFALCHPAPFSLTLSKSFLEELCQLIFINSYYLRISFIHCKLHGISRIEEEESFLVCGRCSFVGVAWLTWARIHSLLWFRFVYRKRILLFVGSGFNITNHNQPSKPQFISTQWLYFYFHEKVLDKAHSGYHWAFLKIWTQLKTSAARRIVCSMVWSEKLNVSRSH